MSGFLRPLAVGGLLFLLVACGEGLFSSLDDPKEVTLTTVDSGTTVQPGSPVPITLKYRSQQSEPVSLVTAVVRAPAGTVVLDKQFSAAEVSAGTTLEVSLEDLPEGVYFLEIQAWRNGSMVLTEERQVFVSSTVPEIRSLAVYPSRLSPHGEAVAVADLHVGERHRPFLRWSLGGRLVREGYADEGFDRAVLAGGSEPGVFRIQLEVFPWGPDEGVRVALGSALRQSGDLVVREPVEPDTDEDSDELLRYDFAGRLEPVINRLDQDRSAVRSGSVVLDVENSRLGYRISADGEMRVPVSLFPVQASAGVQLEIHLVHLSEKGGAIVRIEPAAEYADLPLLRLERRTEPAAYVLHLGSQYGVYEINGEEREKTLGITLVREPEALLVTLEVQGTPVLALRKDGIDGVFDGESKPGPDAVLFPGRIVLGASAAAPVLLTDLSIRRLDPDDLEMPVEQVAQD